MCRALAARVSELEVPVMEGENVVELLTTVVSATKRVVGAIAVRSDGGLTEFVWDGTSRDGSAVASGVYFARVLGDDGVSEARLVKLR